MNDVLARLRESSSHRVGYQDRGTVDGSERPESQLRAPAKGWRPAARIEWVDHDRPLPSCTQRLEQRHEPCEAERQPSAITTVGLLSPPI